MRAAFLVCAALGCRAGGPGADSAGMADAWLTDFHAHATLSSHADVPALLDAMAEHEVARTVLSRPPNALQAFSGVGTDTADLVAFFEPWEGERRYLYGGQELVPLLHAVGRPTPFTFAEVYPEGADPTVTEAMLAEMTAIAADPDPWEAEFRRLATAAADDGRYVGFGELAPVHHALGFGHPDIRFPADHPWLLWLADLAAERGMILDVHLEATEESLAELDRLLDHNLDTTVVWEHAGWSDTGLATPAVLETTLAAHDNLYLGLKLREPETEANAAVHPLDADGVLRPEWKALLEGWPDRVMVTSDMDFWANDRTAAEAFADRFGLQEALLDQLSHDCSESLRARNAVGLIGF